MLFDQHIGSLQTGMPREADTVRGVWCWGAGKGMHSRLFKRVLNKYDWVQNCTAFNSLFQDTGLVGIFISAASAHAPDLINLLSKELQVGPVSGLLPRPSAHGHPRLCAPHPDADRRFANPCVLLPSVSTQVLQHAWISWYMQAPLPAEPCHRRLPCHAVHRAFRRQRGPVLALVAA